MTFPTEDLVPKKETNVLSFLQQNPQYDGRNVRIGILDTGMDPGASGLFHMADGVSPKLMDMVDCTGSGDVDVSHASKAVWVEDHWEVTGLSGRPLQLHRDWTFAEFPSAKNKKSKKKEDSKDSSENEDESSKKSVPVRLGIKRAYELFPDRLQARVKEDRKRIFQEHVDKYVARVRSQLTSCKTKTPEQNKVRDDLQAQLDVLTSTEWISDPGPLWDCVVFFDGVDYRVVVDGEETGSLQHCKPMTSFAKERQYGTFSVLDQFNYGVNFYKDGTVLSIVSDASPHGSHVAGIAAAAQGERSGVAPGAELVSLKIGDSRLGSMETGASLTRAMIEAVRLKCDIINLSYGEGCKIPNSGRFVELAEDLVWKHNIVFIAAAGNNGPALTTLGSPGGTTSAIIGVSAYVSPEMMKAAYGFVNPTDENHFGTTFTWSSVGPTADGDFGNNVTAPGGAITSVSNWCLQKSQLMNGTSMASPHATGCVALLISACKAENIPVTPERIKRALENTASRLPHLSVLQQGCGIIQVDKALDYLREHKNDACQDVFYAVTVNKSGNPRGIYLRQAAQTLARQTFSVEIDPKFEREDRVSEEVQKRKLDFEMEFELEASQPWVTAPDYFMLMHNGRSFNIVVDPVSLGPGLHTAMVIGYSTRSEKREPMFRVPITVTKPLPLDRTVELGILGFEPAETKRFFVVPPPGTTWMDVTLRDRREDADVSSRLFVLHTVQLLPHCAWRDHEKYVPLSLLPNQSVVTSIAVEDGVTCEICLARYWSTIGESKVEASIQFRGVRPVPNYAHILAGSHGSLLRLHSDLQDEVVNPNANLERWLTPIRPKTEPTPSPLGERDILPSCDRQIYELILEYDFEQEEKGSFIARAYPLQNVLYESAFESQMMLFFDSDKMYLGASDAYAKEITAPKGTVSLRIQIRHDDPVKLSTLKEMIVWIERKIEKDISLSIFPTKETLVKGSGSFKKTVIRNGSCLAMYIAEPPQTKLPSGCKAGDILAGTVTYGGENGSAPGAGKRPGGYPISYLVGPKSKKPSGENDVAEPKDERTPEEKMAEAIRDLKVAHLGKAIKQEDDEDVFTKLFTSIQQDYPDHLPLHAAKLRYMDGQKRRAKQLSEVVSACDEIITRISEDELALHFGRKVDTDDPKASKEREEMKDKKSFLIEALVRKALAYSDMETDDAGEHFDATMKQLKLWADVDSSDKYATLFLVRETRASRYGNVLKTINKLLTKDAKDDAIRPLSRTELLTRRSEAFEKLGFSLLEEYDRSNRVIASPKSYMLF